jgi:hypothetical protein
MIAMPSLAFVSGHNLKFTRPGSGALVVNRSFDRELFVSVSHRKGVRRIFFKPSD